MLSINIVFSASAIRWLRPWLGCHCPGIAISRGFEGCSLFLSDPIPVPAEDSDVQSDLPARFVSVHHGEKLVLKWCVCLKSRERKITCIVYKLCCRDLCSCFLEKSMQSQQKTLLTVALRLTLQYTFLGCDVLKFHGMTLGLGNEEGEHGCMWRPSSSHRCSCPRQWYCH